MLLKTRARGSKIEISLYLMLIPALVLVLTYAYVPLFGLVIAFEKYDLARGFFSSKWVGLDNFRYLFTGYRDFPQIIWNTVFIATMKIIARFIAPIVVAILLNEVAKLKFKRTV